MLPLDRFAIRADCNGEIGMGHVMRCVAIASAVEKLGGEVTFVVSPDSDASAIINLGFDVHRLKKRHARGWDANEFAEWAYSSKVKAMLVDSYRVDQEALLALREICRVYYLDDLYAFDYPVEGIINYDLDASLSDYAKTHYVNRSLYLGPAYFPAREEFLTAKYGMLRRKVSRILVTTGSTEASGFSGHLLPKLLGACDENIAIDILLGRFYSSRYQNSLRGICKEYSNVTLLGPTNNMGDLLAAHDIVIGPGSTTSFESFTVGTPYISYSFADNQMGQCEAMQIMGMAPYAGDVRTGTADIVANCVSLCSKMLDFSVRCAYQNCYASIFDGRGADRIAKVLLADD